MAAAEPATRIAVLAGDGGHKLTGLGTLVRRVDPDLIAVVVERCLQWFGPDRCMWGSNFPVEKLWTDYETLSSTCHGVMSQYDITTRELLFGGTARRVYGL